jgi:TonB-linked SusC/RagA family outer membrane protein
VLAGTEAIRNQSSGVFATDNNFPDQDKNLVYLGNGQGLKTNGEGVSSNSLLSYFGKVSYDYNSKYLASVTVRRDGSSRFGLENRWGTFYAGSLGWRLDKEDFLANTGFVDLLLLRAGYGQIGNQEISDFPSAATVGTSYFYPYGSTSRVGYAINQLGNNQVKWETSNQFNAGIDFETLNGNLLLTVDYFNKVTSDLLVSQPIASSAGLANPAIVNNGQVVNSGYELAITYEKNIRQFNYAIAGNVATLHNEILEVDPVIQGGAIGSDNITLIEKGYPIGSFYLYEMEGIFQNETEIFTHANQGGNIKPGDVKYKDQNNDGVIDGNDRVHSGSPIPKITAGLNLSFNYKNWDLSVFFQGAYGQKIFSVVNRDIEGFYRPFNVTERYYENRWTGEGSTNEFPRASWDASGNNTRYSTRFLEDGSYTRLKNLQVGYSLPSDLLSKFGCSAFRIYLSGTNLWTLTNYQGLDPEMTVSDNALGQGDRAAGMDWGTYPSSSSYNVGVSITF